MNHWILSARDVMWVVFAIAPLVISSLAGSEQNHMKKFDLYLMAVMVQTFGIVLLYNGIIK